MNEFFQDVANLLGILERRGKPPFTASHGGPHHVPSVGPPSPARTGPYAPLVDQVRGRAPVFDKRKRPPLTREALSSTFYRDANGTG